MRNLVPLKALIVAIGIGALVVAGCGDDDEPSGGGGAAESGEPKSLTVAASGADTYPFMGLLQIAVDEGWFEEEGLDVEIVAGEGGGDTLRVASTGSADMAIAGGTSVVLAAADPAQNLEIIGPWYQVNDFVWLTPDDNVSLDGATLGVTSAGSSTELMVKGFQDENPDAGIKPVTVGGVGDQWAAVKADRITGGFSLPPYTQQVVAEEGAKVLISGADVLGDLPADLVAVNKDYAAENAEALQAFWRVADRAFDYAREDPAAAAADLAELIPIDAKYIQQALEEYESGYDITVDEEILDNLSELMVKTGTIEKPIDWATVLNQDYLPEDAKAELGGTAG